MNTSLAPSLLAANFAHIAEDLHEVEVAGCYYLHLDVMDGHFVPPITFGSQMVAALRPLSKMFFDVHLMTYRIENHIETFAKAGANQLCFHYEAAVHHLRLINRIKELGCSAGISLVPSTPIFMLEELLPFIDNVLVMSVNPGYGGQQFIEQSYARIAQLEALKQKHHLNFQIAVDGGVTLANAAKLYQCGANLLIAGSALFNSPNRLEFIEKFGEIFKSHDQI